MPKLNTCIVKLNIEKRKLVVCTSQKFNNLPIHVISFYVRRLKFLKPP